MSFNSFMSINTNKVKGGNICDLAFHWLLGPYEVVGKNWAGFCYEIYVSLGIVDFFHQKY